LNIAYIIESTSGRGGMERMLATIANELARQHKVTVISAFNEGKQAGFPLAEKITQVDLQIVRKRYSVHQQKKEYHLRLEEYLFAHPQDFCISLGSLEFFFLPKIKDGSRKIFWFHFALNYDVVTCRVTGYQQINRMIGSLRKLRRIYYASKYHKVVVLTKSDCKKWRRYLKNVDYIYNPVTITPNIFPDYSAKRAIAVGRLDYQKGFDYLIEAWNHVAQKHPDWHLDIYGEGSLSEILQGLIVHLGLSNRVHLCGFSRHLEDEYARHSFYILSSRYEGFGLVIVEAAACGLATVAYACEQGPSEIIETGVNGILIPKVGDINGLADSITYMIEHDNERESMGRNAKELSKRYNLETICHQWRDLLESLK
jgi:glycosyltransferase involved in cell wall biosynthesis